MVDPKGQMRPQIAYEKRPIDYSVEGRPVSKHVAKKIRLRLRCSLPHAGLHELEVDEPRMRAICRGCGVTYSAHDAHQLVGRGTPLVQVPGITLLRLV